MRPRLDSIGKLRVGEIGMGAQDGEEAFEVEPAALFGHEIFVSIAASSSGV